MCDRSLAALHSDRVALQIPEFRQRLPQNDADKVTEVSNVG